MHTLLTRLAMHTHCMFSRLVMTMRVRKKVRRERDVGLCDQSVAVQGVLLTF